MQHYNAKHTKRDVSGSRGLQTQITRTGGSGSGKTPQGLQQNSLACEILHIFHSNARNRDASMIKDQDSVVCGLGAPGTFIRVFGGGWDAAGPFQFSEQFFP